MGTLFILVHPNTITKPLVLNMPSLYAKKVAKCEAMLNITFSNKLLCLEALQMSGNMLPWNEQFLKVNKNDRLAVLGDTVLKSYLCKKC